MAGKTEDETFVVFDYPDYWPDPVYDFSKNPLTQDGIALGRALFYDPILSADSTISCANCHLSYTAFTHVDHALSHGINDSIGDRNSMALTNLAWASSFMWDGAINHLDVQGLAPISHPAEMGSSIADAVDRVNQSQTYPPLFKSAFGEEKATGEFLLKALSQFQLTLISANSKYDQVQAGKATFTGQEQRGLAVFEAHCQTCHAPPLFTTGLFANNGLAVDGNINDVGRMRITQSPKDSLLFKIPSLRNVEYSRPYMHDGRFKKLSDVIAHYSSGIHKSKTLSPHINTSLHLDEKERIDLLAFLLTLSDREYIMNPDHAFPR